MRRASRTLLSTALTLGIALAWLVDSSAQNPASWLTRKTGAAGLVDVPVCGDGAIVAGEECDDANAAGGDCCSATCQFEPSAAACDAGADVDDEFGSFAGPFRDLTAGWEFRVRSDLTVTALGVYDREDDGLDEGHQVAIWEKTATPMILGMGTVPSGTGADLVAHFRVVPIPALALVAGHTYVIGALYPETGSDWVVDSGEFRFDPRITFVTGREIYSVAGGLQYPSSPESDRFGPTFLFTSRRGNGLIDTDEQCDDGNVASADGCSSNGAIEVGYACNGTPSVCAAVCGDGKVAGAESCDDGDTMGGDGCSASCAIENDYTCKGAPSVCTNTCGNGVVDGGEFCDDGDKDDGDGCSSRCSVEVSYTCAGNPSVCTTKCGDGAIDPLEQCDDGNSSQGDCCSRNCEFQPANAACRKSMPVPQGGGGSGGTGGVEGWEFTVTTAVTVTALGVFDDPSSAGLNEEHPIAIWNSSKAVLASATVPAGTVAPLVNGFRYVPIARLNLVPGMSYTIGAFMPAPREDEAIGAQTLPLEPQLSLVQGRRLPFVDSLVFPTALGSAPQIGPGLLFEFIGCGNGALDAGEQCDDGNAVADDCCSANCEIIAGDACQRGEACPGDCNRDGLTTAGELERITAIMLNCDQCSGGVAQGCPAVPGADKQCSAADFDGDGCLSAADLARVIANITAAPSTGCPEEPED